jgi:regulator of nucleoside diphosphate kinase
VNAPNALRLPPVILIPRDYARLEIFARLQLAAGNLVGRFLRRELERAVICLPEQLPPGIVTMRSQVRFVLGDAAATRALVYPEDQLTIGQCVSIASPLGAAMIGLNEVSVMPFRDHQGESCQVAIERVVYQPQRDGPVAPANPAASTTTSA